jgi:hypothetical protein
VYILDGLGMENIGICILWLFGMIDSHLHSISYGHLIYFSRFGILHHKNSGIPGLVGYQDLWPSSGQIDIKTLLIHL